MLLLQYFHDDELLLVGSDHYRATCRVRNELNRWRSIDQVVLTWPVDGERSPYYPRPFPTGVWKVGRPLWTHDPEYAPVKIPTDARRRVLIRETPGGSYGDYSGEIQEDSFYHLHYAAASSTTLGCIRLDSDSDARQIARRIERSLDAGENVFIEILCKRSS